LAFVSALVACRTTDSAEADPAPPAKHDASAAKAASAASAPSAAIAFGVKAHGVELVNAPPGDVPEIVLAARAAARAHGRAMMVYIGATWCEPCQRFHHAAESGSLDDEFPTLSLLVFDADQDSPRLRAAGYAPGYIPYFGVPGDDGHGTSIATEGGIKGDGAVGHIVPRLLPLVEKAEKR
jgi:thiol-disulfide isomerase/thioredoxin